MTAHLGARYHWERQITDSNLPSSARLVALVLATYFSKQRPVAFPTQVELAAKTGLSRRCVQDQVELLKRQGWLVVREHAGPGKRADRRPHLYEPAVPERVAPVATRDGQRVANDDTNGWQQVRQEQTIELTDHKTRESTPSAPTGANGKQPRPRDPLFDALACAGRRVDLEHLPASTARTIAVKLAELRKAQPDITPEEITRRANRYRREHPDWALTPAALVKHWAELAPDAGRSVGAARCAECHVQGPLSVCTLGADYGACPGNVVRASERARP